MAVVNSERTTYIHLYEMDNLFNNTTEQYDEIYHGLPPIDLHPAQTSQKIFQSLLQFLHFVVNKRNITHEQYFRIHSEFVR